MGKTAFYNMLKICRSCMDEYVLEYAIAVEPPWFENAIIDRYIGKCDICGNLRPLLSLKYVTVIKYEKSEING